MKRLHDAGMVVAQGAAHLTRVEVQVLFPIHIPDN